MGENIYVAIIFSIFFLVLAFVILYILIKKPSKNLLANIFFIIVFTLFLFLSAKFSNKAYQIFYKYKNIEAIHQKLHIEE